MAVVNSFFVDGYKLKFTPSYKQSLTLCSQSDSKLINSIIWFLTLPFVRVSCVIYSSKMDYQIYFRKRELNRSIIVQESKRKLNSCTIFMYIITGYTTGCQSSNPNVRMYSSFFIFFVPRSGFIWVRGDFEYTLSPVGLRWTYFNSIGLKLTHSESSMDFFLWPRGRLAGYAVESMQIWRTPYGSDMVPNYFQIISLYLN